MDRDVPIVMAFVIGIAVLLGVGGYRIYARIDFQRHCKGYLKNAADANTIEQAEKRLAIAVDYIQENELNYGYTSILWTVPEEDVAFWAENLTTALDNLRSVSEDATELERSNVLMKLRETILDDTQAGQQVTVPAGISVFPYNRLLAITVVIALAMIFIPAWLLWGDSISVIEALVVMGILAILLSTLLAVV